MTTKGTYDLLGTGSVRVSVKVPASWRKFEIRIKAVRKAAWLVRKSKTAERKNDRRTAHSRGNKWRRASYKSYPHSTVLLKPPGRAAYRKDGIVEQLL